MADSKLFSMINEAKIKLAPGQKLLKAKELEQLLTAKELIEQSQEQATRYRKEVTVQLELEKEQAREEGYQKGLELWAQEMEGIEQEIAKAREEFEGVVLKAAMAAAKKFVGRELEQKPETLLEIVAKSLKAVAQHKKIVIYCSKNDFDLLDAARPQLKAHFEQLESLTVQVKGGIDGYIIETERGIINHGRLEDLWGALEKAFGHALAKKKQAAT